MTPPFLRVLCASVVSLSALSYGAYVIHRNRTQLARQQTAWQQTQTFEARLDQPVDIRFTEATTIHQWLAEWSQQTGLAAEVNGESVVWDAQQLPPIALPPNCSAREALQILAALKGYSWVPNGNGVVVYQILNQIPISSETYPLPAGLSEQAERAIAHALQHSSQTRSFFAPDDDFLRQPGSLIVSQPYHVHLSIERKLAVLHAALAQCATLPPHLVLPDDPRVQPIRLGDNNEAYEQLERGLDRRITLPLSNVPLKEFAARISQELKVPVNVVESRHLSYAGVTPDSRVNNTLRNVSIRSILRNSLGDLNLTFHPDESGRSLQITTYDFSYNQTSGVTRIYPVGDLVEDTAVAELGPLLGAVRKTVSTEDGHFHGRCNFGPLVALLNDLVEPDSWDATGGPGRITACGPYRALLVTQRPDVHEQLEELLSRLRRVRAGQLDRTEGWSVQSSEQKRLIELLQQPFAMEYSEVTWENLIADVQARTGLPIKLSKHFEDAGVKPSDVISVKLPARSLGENLRTILRDRQLKLALRDDHVVVTTDNTGYEDGPVVMTYELFDIRNLRSQPGVRAELRNLVRAVITPDFWEDQQGPAFISKIGGVMVIQHEPNTLDRIRPLLTTLLADVTTGKQTQSQADLLDLRAKERFFRPSGADEPLPVSCLYSVADLLEPRGQLTPDELLAHVKTLHSGEAEALSEAWSFEIRLGHYLHVLSTSASAKRVESLLRDLRQTQEDTP